MDSCHGNPSPSDPMESVCRYFRPPPQLYFAEYVLSLLRTHMRRSDGFLPRQPVSIGSDGVRLPTFSTPPQLDFAVYVLSLSRTDSRQAHGFLPRQPVSIGSDGVRLPIFPTPSSTLLRELSSGESGCSWPSSIGLSLGVLDNPHFPKGAFQCQLQRKK